MKNLRRLLPYFARYRGPYWNGLFFAACASVVGAAAPLLIKRAIDELERGPNGRFILLCAGAVVGTTGSGKSTLASALLRLYPVPRGTIFVDGCDLNDVPAAGLRKAIGCVPQDPFLFSDTLRANIAFGGADDAADVERAARLARIAAEAERFPGGLHQMIGERGVSLSGGQKQRTALARAIVREPRILILDDALSSVDAHTEREILDEATSSVDSESEALIQEALARLLEGRTSIVIAHRLSTIRGADRILVLHHGRVSEEGRHEDLLRRGGLYSKLHRLQFETA